MRVEKTTLTNGVRILTQHMPHVRSIATGIWVNVGARDEKLEENGLSHCIEHMIFKGTRRRSAFEIAKEFDAIGGQSNAFTAMETTCYHARVVDSHMETMVDILSDIFLSSVFDAGELEKERMVIAQEMEMIRDSPEEYIHQISDNAFWGDHPLGRPIAGTPENLSRFDGEMLRDFFQRLYQPERIVISAAGNLDHERFVSAIGPHFESIRGGNGFPERAHPAGGRGVTTENRDLGQVHLCLAGSGLSVTDERRYAGALLMTLLGGNMSSRLFQEIREKHGMVYNVYSFSTSYSDCGMSGIYFATHTEKAAKALSLVLKEFDRLKETMVPEQELADAKEFTKAGMLMALESVDNQMVRLAQNEIHLRQHLPIEDVIQRIEAVSAGDLQTLAQELFRASPLTLTLLGPVDSSQPYTEILSGR